MRFSYYRLWLIILLMLCEFFIIVSMALNNKIDLALNICGSFWLIRELCKENIRAGETDE